jgi:hypothetical protein
MVPNSFISSISRAGQSRVPRPLRGLTPSLPGRLGQLRFQKCLKRVVLPGIELPVLFLWSGSQERNIAQSHGRALFRQTAHEPADCPSGRVSRPSQKRGQQSRNVFPAVPCSNSNFSTSTIELSFSGRSTSLSARVARFASTRLGSIHPSRAGSRSRGEAPSTRRPRAVAPARSYPEAGR